MASRYGVQPSSSSSSDDEASEAEGDRCKALQKAYCDAITKLTPDIVPVLQHEITAILPKAYSKGLVGKSVYSKGIAMQGDPGQKTGEFLMTVKSQIYTGIEFYGTFLEILRNTEAIGHIARMIETEANSIHRERAKPKRASKRAHRKRKEASTKLDSRDSATSGFQSDFSTALSADTLQTHEQNQDPNSTSAVSNINTLAGAAPHEVNSTPVESTSDYSTVAHFYIPGSEATQESMQAPDEENRAFKEGERIGGSVEESVQYQHPTPTSGASMVFSGIVTESFDTIQRVAEHEKRRVQMVISEKDGHICFLQKQIATLENEITEERKRLKEEIKRKEAELQQSHDGIEQKTEEIDSLKKAHADELDTYKARIQKLEEEKASLEQENNKAVIEIAHLKSRLEKEEKIATQAEEIAALKDKLSTKEREESEKANQARINQMQAEMDEKEATIQELKDSGAGENLRSLTERQEQMMSLLQSLHLCVQRSVSSSSGISSGSNADSCISPTSSAVEIVEKVTSVSVMEVTRTTNISGLSASDDSILELPENGEEEKEEKET